MVYATVLINLVLASAVLAAPSLEYPVDRSLDKPIIYTPGQAGAVYENQTRDTYSALSGVFTVPTIHESGLISVFVGMDVISCGAVNFQTGVTFFTDGKRPSVWYTWYGYAGQLAFTHDTDLHFMVGHSIELHLLMNSHRSGTATITNKNNSLSVTQVITSPYDALCGKDAMWIVSASDPFISFDTIVFSDVVATTPVGDVGPQDAQIMSMVWTHNLTTVSLDTSTITIQHLG